MLVYALVAHAPPLPSSTDGSAAAAAAQIKQRLTPLAHHAALAGAAGPGAAADLEPVALECYAAYAGSGSVDSSGCERFSVEVDGWTFNFVCRSSSSSSSSSSNNNGEGGSGSGSTGSGNASPTTSGIAARSPSSSEGRLVACAVADEASGRDLPFACAYRLLDALLALHGAGEARTARAHGLQAAFGPVIAHDMLHCGEHPEEVSAAASRRAAAEALKGTVSANMDWLEASIVAAVAGGGGEDDAGHGAAAAAAAAAAASGAPSRQGSACAPAEAVLAADALAAEVALASQWGKPGAAAAAAGRMHNNTSTSGGGGAGGAVAASSKAFKAQAEAVRGRVCCQGGRLKACLAVAALALAAVVLGAAVCLSGSVSCGGRAAATSVSSSSSGISSGLSSGSGSSSSNDGSISNDAGSVMPSTPPPAPAPRPDASGGTRQEAAVAPLAHGSSTTTAAPAASSLSNGEQELSNGGWGAAQPAAQAWPSAAADVQQPSSGH